MEFEELEKLLEQKRKYARKNYIPIIRDKSAKFLYDYVKENNIKNVLEIGTAIGYSGSIILTAGAKNLTTIDINKDYLKIAEEVFKSVKVDNMVEIICGDARKVILDLVKAGKAYDLIFLDGAKGQYLSYLPTLTKLLNDYESKILADNIFLGGLVEGDEFVHRKKRAMVTKLREFLRVIKEPPYESEIVRLEDGIAIIKYRGE